MYELSNALKSNVLNIEDLMERILKKFSHLTLSQKRFFKDKVLKPNLEVILRYKDIIFITNLCNAATIYKQLHPSVKFAPIVLNFIIKNHLPYFYYVYYQFFDCMTISERKSFGFDIKLFSDTFLGNSKDD